mmetsp:Transcript_64076/g.202722  ORF Transcript_64076/g.202722 Transcript_64076/m.202722 type:complete len:423 (+) Transcript_64076:111-1379(+)
MGLGDSLVAKKLKRDAGKAVKKGDYDEAAELLEKALARVPRDVSVMVELGKVKLLMKDYAAAASVLEEAQTTPSDEDEFGVLNHEYYYALGEAYDKQHRCGDCIDAYEQGLHLEHVPCSKNINYQNIYFRLGVNCKMVKDWGRAVEYFDKVNNPAFLAMRRGDILCEMEECYREMGEEDEADDCMRQAVESEPPIRKDYVAEVAWYGYCMNQGQGRSYALGEDGPVAKMKECIKTDKKNWKNYFRLGRIHMDLGMLEEAEENMRYACAYDRDNAMLWRTLSELYARMGDEKRSLRALQQAAELGDYANRSEALMQMADFLKDKGMDKEAAGCYDKLDPKDPKAIAYRNELLHKSAVRIQKVFRGNLARKNLKRQRQRVTVRNYGSRAPLRNHNVGKVQKMGAYKTAFVVSGPGGSRFVFEDR